MKYWDFLALYIVGNSREVPIGLKKSIPLLNFSLIDSSIWRVFMFKDLG